jgi:hypothetical protein
VLSSELELVHLDGEQWPGWIDLLWPAELVHQMGWVVVFTDRDRLVKAVRGGYGALDLTCLPWRGATPKALATLRQHLGAGLVAAVDLAAVADIAGDVQAALALDCDYAAQALELWNAVQRAHRRGRVHVDPPLLDLVPALSPDALQRTFDLLIPDGTSAVAYVFDGARIHASIVASKDRGDIQHATTHAAIADAVSGPALARTWRQRYRRVLEVVSERYGPPSLGVFVDRAAVERVFTGPVDQLPRELSRGNLVVDPAPVWLTTVLGGAAVAGVATRSAKTLSRFVPKGARRLAEGMARQAQDQLKKSGFDPWAALGFNPIELWLEIRKLVLRRP